MGKYSKNKKIGKEDDLVKIYDKKSEMKQKVFQRRRTHKKGNQVLFNKVNNTKKKIKNVNDASHMIGGKEEPDKVISKQLPKLETNFKKLETAKKNLIKEQKKLVLTLNEAVFRVKNIVNIPETVYIRNNKVLRDADSTDVIPRQSANLHLQYLKLINRADYPGDEKVARRHTSIKNYNRDKDSFKKKGVLRIKPHFYKVPPKKGYTRQFKDDKPDGQSFFRMMFRKPDYVDTYTGSKVEAHDYLTYQSLLHIRIARYRERELQYRLLMNQIKGTQKIIKNRLKISKTTSPKSDDINKKIDDLEKSIEELINKSIINFYMRKYAFYNIHRILLNPPESVLAPETANKKFFFKRSKKKFEKRELTYKKQLNKSSQAMIKFFDEISETVSKLMFESINRKNASYPKFSYNEHIASSIKIADYLFDIKSLFIYKDYDKPYLDMGQISLMKLFQPRKRSGGNANLRGDFFLGNPHDNISCFFRELKDTQNNYFYYEYYKKHRFRLLFNNLLQVPPFIEKYLTLVLCTQEKPGFEDDADKSKGNSKYEEIQINIEEIKKSIGINEVTDAKEFEDKYIKTVELKPLVIKNSKDGKYRMFLPLSSYLAMVKPANTIIAQYKEHLNKWGKKGKQKLDTNNPPAPYNFTYFDAYYTQGQNTILLGTIRYTYDTIRNMLYFLFSENPPGNINSPPDNCSFINTYLSKEYIKTETSGATTFSTKKPHYSVFDRQYLSSKEIKFIDTKIAFIKQYGIYKGLIQYIFPLIYVISIYLDHIHVLIKHLKDLAFLVRQFKNMDEDIAKKYDDYYKKYYKHKLKSKEVTEIKEAATTDNTSKTEKTYESSYYALFDGIRLKSVRGTTEKPNIFKPIYDNFVNVKKIDDFTKFESYMENKVLNVKFGKDDKIDDSLIDSLGLSESDKTALKDESTSFAKLVYILYVDYHSKDVEIKDIKKHLIQVANIIKNRDKITSGTDNNVTGINFDNDDFENLNAVTVKITLLDYIDYYYYDVYVYNYMPFNLLMDANLDNIQLTPTGHFRLYEDDPTKPPTVEASGFKHFAELCKNFIIYNKNVSDDKIKKGAFIYNEDDVTSNGISKIIEYIKSDFKDATNVKDIDPFILNVIVLYLFDTNQIYKNQQKIGDAELEEIIKNKFKKEEDTKNESKYDITIFLNTYMNYYQNKNDLITKTENGTPIINSIGTDITKIKFFDLINMFLYKGIDVRGEIPTTAVDAKKIRNIYNYIYGALLKANFIPILDNKLYYDETLLEGLRLDKNVYITGNENKDKITEINGLLDDIKDLNKKVMVIKLKVSVAPTPSTNNIHTITQTTTGYGVTSNQKKNIIKSGMEITNIDPTITIKDVYMKDGKINQINTVANNYAEIPYFVTTPDKSFEVRHLPKYNTMNHPNYDATSNRAINLSVKEIKEDPTLGSLQSAYNALKEKIDKFNKEIAECFECIYFHKKFKKMNDAYLDSSTTKTQSNEIGSSKTMKYPGQFIFLNNYKIDNLGSEYITDPDKRKEYDKNKDKDGGHKESTLGINDDITMPVPEGDESKKESFELYKHLFDYSDTTHDDPSHNPSNHNHIFYTLINGKSKLELRNIAENTILKKMKEYKDEIIPGDSKLSQIEQTKKIEQINGIFKNFKNLLLPLCNQIKTEILENCFLIDEPAMENNEDLYAVKGHDSFEDLPTPATPATPASTA